MTETTEIPINSTGAAGYFATLAYPNDFRKRDHFMEATSDNMVRQYMSRNALRRVPPGRKLHMPKQQQDREWKRAWGRMCDRFDAWRIALWYAMPAGAESKRGEFDPALYQRQYLESVRGGARPTGVAITSHTRRIPLRRAASILKGGADTVRITLKIPTAAGQPYGIYTEPTGPEATEAAYKNFIRDVWTPSWPVLHLAAAVRRRLIGVNARTVADLIYKPDWLLSTLELAEKYREMLPNATHPDGTLVWPNAAEMIRLLPRH